MRWKVQDGRGRKGRREGLVVALASFLETII